MIVPVSRTSPGQVDRGITGVTRGEPLCCVPTRPRGNKSSSSHRGVQMATSNRNLRSNLQADTVYKSLHEGSSYRIVHYWSGVRLGVLVLWDVSSGWFIGGI